MITKTFFYHCLSHLARACTLLFTLTNLMFLSGCSIISPPREAGRTHPVQALFGGKTKAAGTTPNAAGVTQAQVQVMVMNFEDKFVTATWQVYDEVRRAVSDNYTKSITQYHKVFANSNAMAIAAGPNPAVNLLDMVVFVSLGRHVIEEYWVPKVLGAPGKPLVGIYQKLEKEVWEMSAKVLSEDQQKTLRNLIQQWIAANPGHYYTQAIRLNDFTELYGMSSSSQLQAGSLMADVEKAVALAEEGLLLSERIMFYVERFPRVVTMQTDLILAQIANSPEVVNLQENLQRFTKASERLSQVAADLPKFIHEERRATIDHAFEHLDTLQQRFANNLASQEAAAQAVFGDVRSSVEKLGQLADKINTAISTGDSLYRMIDSTPSKLPEYKELLESSLITLTKADNILREIHPLLMDDGKASTDQNRSTVGKTLESAKALADHLFWLGVQLITLFLFGLLAVLVLYRILSKKIG